MSTSIEINREGLSALSISDLTGLSNHIKNSSEYYKGIENQKKYGYVMVILQEQIDERINNIFTF